MANPIAIIPQALPSVKEPVIPVFSFTEIRGLLSEDDYKRACDEMLEIYNDAHSREDVSDQELTQIALALYLLEGPRLASTPRHPFKHTNLSEPFYRAPVNELLESLDGITTTLENLHPCSDCKDLFPPSGLLDNLCESCRLLKALGDIKTTLQKLLPCSGCKQLFPPATLKDNLCESCRILTPDILSPTSLHPRPSLLQARSCKDCCQPIELGVMCSNCEKKLLLAISQQDFEQEYGKERYLRPPTPLRGLQKLNASPHKDLSLAPAPTPTPMIAHLLAEGCQVLWQVQTKFTNLPKSIYNEVTSLMRRRSLMPMSSKSTFFHNASTGTLTAYCQELDAKAIELTLCMMGLSANVTPCRLLAKVS